MNKRRILANILIMTGGQVATMVLSLVFLVICSRYLGPTRFGELILAKSIVMVAWLGANMGMDTVITRSVARSPERAGPLASAAMAARSLLAVPVIAGVILYGQLTHLNAETVTATYIYAAGEVVWSLQMAILPVFVGRERMALNTAWTVGHNVLGLCFALPVMALGGSVPALATADVLVSVVLFVPVLRWMRTFGRLTWRISRRDLHDVTIGGLAFWINAIFFNVYLYIDAVILGALAGPLALGVYTPATRVLAAAMFMTGIIGTATLPMLSRLGIDAKEDFDRASRKTLGMFILCAVPLTIGVFSFAGPLILTVWGAAYAPSVPVLMILSLCIVPMFLNSQFSQILTASDRQWRWTAALGACCIVNPLLNFFAIPYAQHTWHNGALGAALAWLVTEIVEVGYGSVLLRTVLFDRDLGRTVAGVSVAGLAQAVLLRLTVPISPIAGEAVAAVTFTAAVIALGVLPREDLSLLVETLTGRLRHRSAEMAAADT